MRKTILAVCVVAAASWAMPADAEEMVRLYSGIRPLGMGNAFAAVADDKNAAFYNPAGLARVSGERLELLTGKMEVSQNLVTFHTEARLIGNNGTAAAVDLLSRYVGRRQHIGVELFPNYTTPGFEIGLLGRLVVDAESVSFANPALQSDTKADTGLVFAMSHPLDEGFNAGVTLKLVQRDRYSKVFTAADVASTGTNYINYTDNKKSAAALGADVGFTYQLDFGDWKPRAALVVQNIGDMNFGDYQYSPTSPSIPNGYKQQINLGTAITVDTGYGMATVAADYNDVGGNVGTGNNKIMRLHIGGEITLSSLLVLRAGLNQSYFTFGAGLTFWHVKLDYAYYAEEVGAAAGDRADDRHAIEMNIVF